MNMLTKGMDLKAGELENKFKNISNKITFESNYSMRDCVIEVKIDDLMAYFRFVENMEKIKNAKQI